MYHQYYKKLIKMLFFLTIFICANDLEIDISATSQDPSVDILRSFFGNVGTSLICVSDDCNTLAGEIFSIYNMVVLALGSSILFYITVISASVTAQEGQVMGQKWSSVWMPIRSALGIGSLVPGMSGFSFLQIFLMYIIMQGIGAANLLWNTVLDNIQVGNSVVPMKNLSDNDGQQSISSLFERDLLDVAYCVYRKQAVISEPIVLRTGVFLYLGDNQECGSIKYYNSNGNFNSDPSLLALYKNAAFLYKELLGNLSGENFAGEIYKESSDLQRLANKENQLVASLSGFLVSALNNYKNSLSSIKRDYQITQLDPNNDSDFAKEARKNGWMYVGLYYFSLLEDKTNNNLNKAVIKSLRPSFDSKKYLDKSENEGMNSFYKDLKNNIADLSTSIKSEIKFTMPSIEGVDLSSLSGAFSAPYNAFIDVINEGHSEPIGALRELGAEFLFAIDLTIFAMVTIVSTMALISLSGVFASSLLITGGIVIIVIYKVLMFLGIGVTLAIYLPLLPFLIYTFGVVTWLIQVLETMAAAPIIAIGLIAPDQQYLGKATPAVMMITNIFLRPSLMVLSFILSIRLIHVVWLLLTASIAPIIASAIDGVTLLGLPILISVYVGFLIGIINKCLSLIYLIPDNVLSWIGHQASSQSNPQQMLKSVEDSGTQSTRAIQSPVREASQFGLKKLSEIDDKRKKAAKAKNASNNQGASQSSNNSGSSSNQLPDDQGKLSDDQGALPDDQGKLPNDSK